ncbi:hypothetical protein AAG570_000598 [Ranatra chinensis]|uniref:VOC domain-containing protein n=1 Tax=Ranatra chinensis TaxID=642074 RepID=A0ABD0ZEE8_9HEMI
MAKRALHFVFKVANRSLTTKFYREVLGMKVLRHEEFTEGCDAACNGPYDNRWSKTMVGYGPEDNYFAIELTYNYGVNHYEFGNDFIGITIKSREAIARAKALKWPISNESLYHVVEAPGGYRFYLLDEPEPKDKDPVQKITLASSDLAKSIDYWNDVLGFNISEKTDESVSFECSASHIKLEFRDIGCAVNHAKAYGRIAFSVPKTELPQIENTVRKENCTVLTPLISLDTPGKATVTVVILADPDGHEICFVDDENFRELSQVDSEATILLERYIKKDEARQEAATSE